MRQRPSDEFTGPVDSPRLFARIARWYDVMNRLMSLGRDRHWRALFRFYFADLMPRITGLLSGQPAAYRYLPRSVQRFETPGELVQTMERAGLHDVHCRKLALGTVTLHVGTRARQVREGPQRARRGLRPRHAHQTGEERTV
jgi:ubiquinone/menaquinone biosynthesis C-methylase UbiE